MKSVNFHLHSTLFHSVFNVSVIASKLLSTAAKVSRKIENVSICAVIAIAFFPSTHFIKTHKSQGFRWSTTLHQNTGGCMDVGVLLLATGHQWKDEKVQTRKCVLKAGRKLHTERLASLNIKLNNTLIQKYVPKSASMLPVLWKIEYWGAMGSWELQNSFTSALLWFCFYTFTALSLLLLSPSVSLSAV